MLREYDFIIIGSGPAGLAAAYSLSQNTNDKIAIFEAGENREEMHCLKEKGNDCGVCRPCNVIAGFGGCLTPGSAAKLSFPPSGRKLSNMLGTSQFQKLAEEAWDFYCKFADVDKSLYPNYSQNIQELKKDIESEEFYSLKEYPIYVTNEREHTIFLDNVFNYLSNRVDIFLNTEVNLNADVDWDNKVITLESENRNEQIHFNKLIIATGRLGYTDMSEVAATMDIQSSKVLPMIGIRLIMPSKYLKNISEIHPDFKVKYRDGIDELETFCLSSSISGGKIKYARYDGFVNIDGHVCVENQVLNSKGETLGNFAILYKNVKEDGNGFLEEYAKRYEAISPNKEPVLDSWVNFKEKGKGLSKFFTDYEHDKITKFSKVIIDKISKYSKVDVSTVERETSIIGPEIENIWDKLELDSSFRATPDIYIIGDCTGIAQGIISSIIMGLRVGKVNQ